MFTLIIGFILGFLGGLKLSVVVVSLAWVVFSAFLLNLELDEFTIWVGILVGSFFGIIFGWIYYYVNFQPTTGWTISKVFSWFFTP